MLNKIIICSIIITLTLNVAAIAAVWTETSFGDFADGTYSDGGANIYTTTDGTIKVIGQQLDVNGDGWMDIVFSNTYNDTTYNIDSYIYFGSAGGFSEANRAELDTLGATVNSISDLNDDGYLDIVFSNYHDGTTPNINSYIYWGSETGFSNGNRTELQTHGARGNSIADLELPANVPFKVTGDLTDGTLFEGSDTIRVISKGGKGKPAPALLNFSLEQNFSNPFNPDTWIPYTLAKDVDVVIRIYNLSGQLIQTLRLGHQPAGRYTNKSKAAYWDGRCRNGEKVASGVYYYTLEAGEFRATRKMVIIK